LPLAIFDLDETLLSGDSDHAWGEFLVSKALVDGVQFKSENDRFYEQYRNGQLDVARYLAFSCAPLARIPYQTLEILHTEFMATIIEPIILPKGRALIAQHQAQGDFVMVITATLDFITRPIVSALGINTLLAPVAEFKNGQYTGQVPGIATLGQGKVDRLALWLKDQAFTLQGSTFYSDSRNDLPLLQQVDHPVCVDPDPVLRAHAEAHDWPIISLRGAIDG